MEFVPSKKQIELLSAMLDVEQHTMNGLKIYILRSGLKKVIVIVV